jgi:hypothetical protein
MFRLLGRIRLSSALRFVSVGQSADIAKAGLTGVRNGSHGSEAVTVLKQVSDADTRALVDSSLKEAEHRNRICVFFAAESGGFCFQDCNPYGI